MGIFSSLIGSGISAIGSVASTAMNNKAAAKAQQQQFAHEKEMNEIQNKQNQENWQYQFDTTNAYNTPEAQRKRMEEAGINPALAASGGALNSGSSGAAPQFGSPIGSSQQAIPARFDGIADACNVINNALMQAAQLEKMSAETKKTEKESERLSQFTPLELEKLTFDKDMSKSLSDWQKKMNEDYEKTRFSRVEADIASNEKRWAQDSAEIGYAAANAKNDALRLETASKSEQLQYEITNSKLNYRGQQMALGLVERIAALDNLNMSTEQIEAQRDQARATIFLLAKQALSLDYQNARSQQSNAAIMQGLHAIWYPNSKKAKANPDVMDQVQRSLQLINGGSVSKSYSGGFQTKFGLAGANGNYSNTTTIGASR